MVYSKQTWQNNPPSTTTPVTAESLNHMEDGIAEAYSYARQQAYDFAIEHSWDRGNLPAGTTDLNTMYEPGVYRAASGVTLLNAPPFIREGHSLGFLIVHNIRRGSATWAAREFVRYGIPERWWRVSTNTGGGWSSWFQTSGSNIRPLTAGAVANSLNESADYEVTSGADAEGISNLPVAFPGILQHRQTTTNLKFQFFSSYGNNTDVWFRSTGSLAAGTFTRWRSLTSPPSSDVGLTNAIRIQDYSHRRGGIKRITTGAVAIRIDHGLANFNSEVRATLEAREIPYGLVLCSGQWDKSENAGVTPAMVNSWVEGGLAEVWNHTKHHSSGDGTTAGWQSEILDGLRELQEQIPAAEIDGFSVPGTAGSNFGGYVGGRSVEEQAGTDGGKFILEHHAVATGYMPNTAYRALDGVVRQGMGHITVDQRPLSRLKADVDSAISQRMGLQMMLHPSRLNHGPEFITTSGYIEFLNYIADQRDQGNLELLSPYDILLAQVV